MLYQNLRRGLNSRPFLVDYSEDVSKYIEDFNQDHYTSLYQYSETHKSLLEEKGTLSGIKDTTTNRMYLDFDSSDLEAAQKEAAAMAHRLVDDYQFNMNSINAYFSGKKGFSIEFFLDERITPEQFKVVHSRLSEGFKTVDKVVVDANRIVRVPNTKHQSSGLYKVPLELWELDELSISKIQQLAKKPRNDLKLQTLPVKLNKDLLTWKEILKKPVDSTEPKPLDFSNVPKFLTNCRWSLQNGHFNEGIRHQALLCLASTYKNLGYQLDHVYRMLKGVAELQSKVNNVDRYPDEEIYNNVVLSVFNDSWQNGQFTCKKEGWLQDYCNTLGDHACNKNITKGSQPHTLIDVSSSFKEYVNNIDQNTIKTGIKPLDDLCFITTGSNVGLIGSAGSGKSSIALNILNNTSKNGIKSVFASLDMHRNRMYEKVMYNITGLKRHELYKVFQNNNEGPYLERLKEEYGNVYFFNKSCPTVQDVREYILDCQKESGEKIKLVMLDYFERVTSDFSDDTQASKRIAGELQDLVNDLDIALITLVQPNKIALSSGVDAPIYDYTKIKGSSFLYQSFRQIISIWRPGYNPQDMVNDKYLQMAVLKNDLGELGEMSFMWTGHTGKIQPMEPHQEVEFQEFLKHKEDVKNGKKSASDDLWDS